MIEKNKIREQYLHGLTYKKGKRLAEVIRCEPGRWHTFTYVNGRMVTGEKPDTDFNTARRVAIEFVNQP